MNNRFVVSTHLKNISQIGNLSHIVVKIKNIWNQHLVSYTMNNHSFDHPTSHKSPLDMEVGVARPVTCCCNTSRSHGGRICHLVQGRIVVVASQWSQAPPCHHFWGRDEWKQFRIPYFLQEIDHIQNSYLWCQLNSCSHCCTFRWVHLSSQKIVYHYHSSSSENSAFL